MTACEWCDADDGQQCDRDCECFDCTGGRALDDDADAYEDRCRS